MPNHPFNQPSNHLFIFQPGIWLGEGKITLSTSPSQVPFYTKWSVEAAKSGMIIGEQQVEQRGESEKLYNRFVFSDITENAFHIELDNTLFGKVQGTGVIETESITWKYQRQFIAEEGLVILEGLENYSLLNNGDYVFHAEYWSDESFRTLIDGRIWKKL